MKVTCMGAARTVTGSSFLLESDGIHILIDCGMFQGRQEIQKRNHTFHYAPGDIDYLLLTHAHIDHSGLIPKLVKEGFKGQIITTGATNELCGIMLRDSAHIQETEAEWEHKRNKRRGKKGLPPAPLYTVRDAEASMHLFKPIDYGEPIQLTPQLKARFLDAGHILGSAFIEIWDHSVTPPMKVVFSGDIGQKEQMLVSDPTAIQEADFLFMESTYGDRLHKSKEKTHRELLHAIQDAVKNHEKVIIPAFAVERTQELIYILSRFYHEGLLPEIPIYIDSPLAISATEVFRNNTEFLNDQTHVLLGRGDHPLALPTLSFARTTEESRAINQSAGPAIIIAASGMCDAGRIKHHLRNNLWRPGARIVFVGYQAQGTPGRQIIDGAQKIKLFGEEIAIKAKIHTLGGFSAHADQRELLEWLGNFTNPRLKVFVVHGEEDVSLEFVKAIERTFWLEARAPNWLETLELSPVAAQTETVKTEALQVMPDLNRIEMEIRKLKNKLYSKSEGRLEEKETISARLKGLNEEIQELIKMTTN
ncbi:MAG: MBL fold metallo-hydrolase [Deltaproteobacteria bacterium]|nr:MBL fold metallo-hydrolase [Deltaproteobacteria bacterium]